jgi:SAM-dependent methyltransferase
MQPESASGDRYARERAFHDERFEHDDRPANRFYAIDRSASKRFLDEISMTPAQAMVLEFGCGAEAAVAMRLAEAGRQVTAFDLSPVAIEKARARAHERRLDTRIEFHVMNAEALEFGDGSFDAVYGAGVLHHLDLRSAFGEIARILKPQGRAVFVEPLGHNPAVNLYRRLTPAQRTEDEHPLRMTDISLAEEYFEQVGSDFFALLSMLALPFPHARRSRRAVDALNALDRRLLGRARALRRFAWFVLLDLRRPRSAA